MAGIGFVGYTTFEIIIYYVFSPYIAKGVLPTTTYGHFFSCLPQDKLRDIQLTPQQQKQATAPQENTRSNQSVLEDSALTMPTCKNVMNTPVGFCYVPSSTAEQPQDKNRRTVSMKDNRRNNFVTALQQVSDKGTTANVMVSRVACYDRPIFTVYF